MPHRTVQLIWAAGLILALLVYAIGPDTFLYGAFQLADHLVFWLQNLAFHLGARAIDILRALAIACYVIFFALSIIATGRGLPARTMLVVVTLLFLLLVWHQGPQATGHWLLAFLLAINAAASITRRLTQSP